MSKYLIGCDPEVFVQQNSVFKSAHGLIKGDKENPFKVNKGAVQVDGMALEFNIDPAASEDEFCINVNEVFAQLCKMVPDYQVVTTPVAHFTEAYMKEQPPEALELGCDPDFNAWDGTENKKPNAMRPMRTASGHIHIGWRAPKEVDAMHFQMARIAAMQMDVYLGLGSLFYDDDVERREMYGKAGCMRAKPYGVEYRTLSNAWLKSESLMRWVYRSAQKGLEALDNNRIASKIFSDYDIQKIINTSDKGGASRILRHLAVELPNG